MIHKKGILKYFLLVFSGLIKQKKHTLSVSRDEFFLANEDAFEPAIRVLKVFSANYNLIN